jgi:hypothetical protein
MWFRHIITNPIDVQANRRGKITPDQRRSAFWALGGVEAVLLVAMAFVIVPAFLVPFALTFIEIRDPLLLAVIGGLAAVVAVPLLVFAARVIVRGLLIWQDLTAGQLDMIEGRVSFRRGRYVAEVPGQAFWSADNTLHNIEPGAYRFYVLPRSRHVLSGERLALMSAETAGLADVLSQVLGAAPDDLQANRDGRLGPRQAFGLLRSAVGLGLLMLVLAGMGAMTFVAASSGNSLGERLALLAFGGGLVALGLLVVGVRIVRLVLDALRGEVDSLTGLAGKRVSGGRSRTYYYQIGAKDLPVSREAYNALIEGQHYRIYLGPRSKHVVNAEPVRGPGLDLPR